MKILQVAEALHPKWGGVAEGVYQQSVELMKRGHHVEALSCEVDDVPRLQEAGIPHHRFNPSSLKWRKSEKTTQWLSNNIGHFDKVILNGLWMHPLWAAGLAARRANVPYWVMTHGMLDPWFLRGMKKRAVKRVYWALYEGKTFAGARGILFTTMAEQDLAAANYPLESCQMHVVGYGIQDPCPNPIALKGNETDLLFMSRLHPKKGLELLFEAMTDRTDAKVKIAGTGDDAYVDALKASAANLHDRVEWLGFTSGSAKDAALRDCGAMILPSHQENFGVIVVESLAYGRPVLTTNKVNIWKELESDGAGLVCEDNSASIGAQLRAWLEMPVEERRRMSERARTSFESRYRIESHVDRLLEVLG